MSADASDGRPLGRSHRDDDVTVVRVDPTPVERPDDAPSAGAEPPNATPDEPSAAPPEPDRVGRDDEVAAPRVATEPADPPRARTGLPRAVVVLLGLAGAIIVAAGLRQISGIAAPTFLALTLVICAHPLLTLMARHRVPRWLAAFICLILIYVVVLGLMAALALSVTQLIIVMPNYNDQFVQLYNQSLHWLTSLGVSSQQVNTALQRFDPTSLIPAATSILGSTVNATSTLVFLVVMLVFIGMDAGDFSRRMEIAARQRRSFVEAMQSFAHGVRKYWIVSAVFGLIVAVLDVIALYIIGVPLALTWGLLSFITNFIPNVGFVLGVIPPALLGLLDGGVKEMVAVIVVYSVLNLVVQVIIQPRFTGDAVGVTTTVTFLSLAVWAIILGPLGALLALPATLFVKSMLVDADPRSRWLNALISSRAT